MKGLLGAGAASVLPGQAAASGGGNGSGGGGGGGSEPPTPFDGDEDPVKTVTLVTGHTIRIHGEGDQRRYTLLDEDQARVQLLDLEDGTYVIPDGVDFDRFSRKLFNVDFLIEQGLTDEETDSIPVIVELSADVDDQSTDVSTMAAGGFSPTGVLSSIDSVAGEVAKEQSGVTTQNVLSTDAVERVHLDARYEALLDTSADAINAVAAREQFGVDGSGVSIAVLDTGIDADHPDFGDRVVHQQDFSGDGVADAFGHGTHCAGIAAGAGTVSDGEYVGIAPGADLMNVKVLGDNGSGLLSTIVTGIEHAVDQGADVISMSLGGPTQENGPMVQAVEAAVDAGVTTTVAAGNSYSYQTIGSPGIAESVITVGASNESGGIANFSSGGPTPYEYLVKPEVAAPGVGITSTGSDDAGQYPYTDKSGTSMATPHVAGASALLLEDDPDRTPAEVKDALISTADPLDGEDVYKQGGGVIDVVSALGANLRVNGAVANLGLYEDATTDAFAVELENTGSEAIEVTPSAELVNAQSGDALSDNVSVSPSSVTVEPGATATVDVTVDTADAFGFMSGVVSFDTGSATHHAIFGFVRGLEVAVEKVPHENSGGVAGDTLIGFAHDGSYVTTGSLDASGQHSFLLPDDGGDFSFWSVGELASGEPAMTVERTTIEPGNTDVTLDESATSPRELDTSQVSEHEPLDTLEFDTALYATVNDYSVVASYIFIGSGSPRTTYVSELEADEPTNVGSQYLMVPEELVGGASLDSPAVYHLFYGSLSVGADGEAIPVDPDELAEEQFEYVGEGSGGPVIAPFLYPADEENFPSFIDLSSFFSTGDRVEQTWYRTDQGEYSESWNAGADVLRLVDLVPEADATYDQEFTRAPLTGTFYNWNFVDDVLEVGGAWYADQAQHPFRLHHWGYAFVAPNGYSVTIDGEEVFGGLWPGMFFDVEVPGVEPGNTVGVTLEGNVLGPSHRETTTVADYQATYVPGTANAPPFVDSIDVTGLDLHNDVPAGRSIVFVDVTNDDGSLASVRAFHAPSGTVDVPPMEDASGWQEADVVYGGRGTYGFLVDTAGYEGNVDLSVVATDADGNYASETSFDGYTVTSGADLAAPTTVLADRVNPDSNAKIPVRIDSTADVDAHDLVVDSLRFGSPDAVRDGGGATPINAQRLGNGSLQVEFPVRDTGFACTDDPIAAQLVGELPDGTSVSGADVISEVICGSR